LIVQVKASKFATYSKNSFYTLAMQLQFVTQIGWADTEADCQSSLHCAVVSTGVMSDQIGCPEVSRWRFEHIGINRPDWMGFNDLKHLVACCFVAK